MFLLLLLFALLTPGDCGRDLTWTCMVCGRVRPDAAISVMRRPLQGLEDRFPATRVNVRYCNDRPLCATEAATADRWHAAPLPPEDLHDPTGAD